MSTQVLMTAEAFEAVCAGLGPCELVRGEVRDLSPGGVRHSEITGRVFLQLAQWARATGNGRALTGEAGVKVESDPDTVRGADVAYISFDRLPRAQTPTGFCTVAPELVVEVIGKGQGWREMVEKAGEYLQMGVDRVWVIDPDTRRVHILRSDHEPVALGEDETVVDEAILPGFTCRVAEFFRD